MQFGKVTDSELEAQDLTLPDDHPKTAKVLRKGKSTPPKIHIGCAKWGRKEWVGLIYPPGTKDKDFLDHYVKNFNGIEMNTTFYAIKKNNVENWASRAPEGFKFSPKLSRSISHLKRLNEDVKQYTDFFLEAAYAFGDKLGPSFLQLPENFAGKYVERLADYLAYIPDDFPLFVELRHQDWFDENQVFNETFDMLESKGIGAVITDVGGRRDALHQRLTIPKAFVRFNGYNLHKTDFQRLDDWINRIVNWFDQGLEELHFYLHQQDETNTPVTADYVIEKLNERMGLSLARPNFIPKNDQLF